MGKVAAAQRDLVVPASAASASRPLNRRGRQSMGEENRPDQRAGDTPDTPSKAVAFEKRALARLAEEADTVVDPAVFAATFDLIRVANRLMYDFETNVHRPLGMSWAGFRVLFCTWIEKEVEPRELARLCAVSRGTVSSVLNTLERDKLLRRRRQSTDRRVVTVVITEKGRRRVKEAFELQHAREHQWLGDLDRQTVTGLVTLMRHLLELPRPGMPSRSRT